MSVASKSLLLAAMMALSDASSAQITWDWSWGGSDSGSGTFTTNALSGSSYLITGVTGNWDGASIAGLLGPSVYQYNDNLLLSGATQLHTAGVAFSVAGGIDVNLSNLTGSGCFATGYTSVTSPPISATQFCNQSPWAGSPRTVSATAVPEIYPTSAASGLALLAGGLIVLRGRRRQGIAA